MLPEPLYKALPYLYVIVGLLFIVIIDSDIVILPSVLLVSAGFAVIWMRRKAKNVAVVRKPSKRLSRKGAYLSGKNTKKYKLRERMRRFPEENHTFPLTDSNENMVAFNRRQKERRKKEK